MAKNRFMQELSVDELIDELNFFIPEIQREYVWGYNEREILDTFCQDLIEGKHSETANKELNQKITELTNKGRYNEIATLIENANEAKPMNIGFLYSYEPNYRMEHFPDSDIYKDVYLIDGQQRLTTLFILLFYLSIKEGRSEDFKSMFRFNGETETVAFDYRVRNLTHNFFIDLIKNVDSLEKLNNISQSTWYLMEYANDPTVKSVLSAIEIISYHFSDLGDEYYDYLRTKVKFWHFKTEKTDQGEELYITMNSRGKQLEDNETLRAKLFERIDSIEEIKWSEEWETWQDYFWQNRNKDRGANNSDKGFNEFLKCIAGLEAYKSNNDEYLELNDPIFPSRLIKFLDLEKIKNYFASLKFILENTEAFSENYEYSSWLDSASNFIKRLLFDEGTNWFIDFNDELRARERRHMVFLWSILEYVNQLKNPEQEIGDIYRFMRILWLRYNNYDRSVKTVKDKLEAVLKNGIWYNSSTPEETHRHRFLRNIKDKNYLRKVESALWRLEDHPLNLNGYQVQNINVSHLIDFDANPDDKLINSVHNKFIKLFNPEKAQVPKNLNTLLLHYDFYAMRRRPLYYENWDFSNWRRIIRDLDSEKQAFKTFFNEYKGEDLKDLLVKKEKEFLTENRDAIINAKTEIECKDLLTCIKYYSIVIDDIWKMGRFIAYSHYLPNERLTTFESNALFNTKGHFRGYGHKEFCYLAKESHDDPIGYIKELVKEL